MSAHYAAHWEPSFLGTGGRWSVRMNNHTDVERCATQAEASLRAAALNYAALDKLPYALIGLDGTDLHWPRGYSGEVYVGNEF